MSSRPHLMVGGFLLVAGCGAASMNGAEDAHDVRVEQRFDDVDSDRDAKLDRAEFVAAMSVYTQSFDTDRSGGLVAEELSHGFFVAWDHDASGAISEDELRRGMVAWLPAEAELELTRFDDNENYVLEPAELRAGLSRLGTFATYDDDGDGGVSNAELASLLFANWDVDGDAAIDALEWQFD